MINITFLLFVFAVTIRVGQYTVESRHRGVVQDLYETPDDALDALFVGYLREHVKTTSTFFDPCCGNNAIVNYLVKKGYTNVIGKDKYTVEGESFDLMTDKYPAFDILIANLPFCLKHDVLQLLVKMGVSFILLLPLSIMTTRASEYNIRSHVYKLIIPAPAPKFLHDGKEVMVGPVGWFIGRRGRGNLDGGFQTLIVPRDTTDNDVDDDGFDAVVFL